MSDTIPEQVIVKLNGVYHYYSHSDTSPEFKPQEWSLPVGTDKYPPSMWYAASVHDLTGVKNNGYKHSGLDLNLDVSPWGDVDRGMPVKAITEGVVHYVTTNWSGVGMCVIAHHDEGQAFYARYAHIDLLVSKGESVKAGQVIGTIGNWRQGAGGDHLHFGTAWDAFEEQWLAKNIAWFDPVIVLKKHFATDLVDSMLRKGD